RRRRSSLTFAGRRVVAISSSAITITYTPHAIANISHQVSASLGASGECGESIDGEDPQAVSAVTISSDVATWNVRQNTCLIASTNQVRPARSMGLPT